MHSTHLNSSEQCTHTITGIWISPHHCACSKSTIHYVLLKIHSEHNPHGVQRKIRVTGFRTFIMTIIPYTARNHGKRRLLFLSNHNVRYNFESAVGHQFSGGVSEFFWEVLCEFLAGFLVIDLIPQAVLKDLSDQLLHGWHIGRPRGLHSVRIFISK